MSCRRLLVGLACLLLQSCGESRPLPESDRVLSYELLMRGYGLDVPVQLDEFTPSANTRPASNRFAGRLTLSGDMRNSVFSLYTDELSLAKSPGIESFPHFDFEFVQENGHLLPLEIGPVTSEHPWWEFILEPGPVWDEPADHGFSRAVIPFALKERNADCIHNGVMMFLFSDDGRVSRLVFQISHQTCRYLQFAWRGLVDAEYIRGNPVNAAEVVDFFSGGALKLMPQRPISQLRVDYDGADPNSFGSEEEVAPETMTAFGFVIDGVHYVGDCETPLGEYPYCDRMALPSYSTAKSFVGGLALMRAEKLYPETAQALISDYVPECADGWDGVTIEHALDMATGHYHSAVPHADEDAAILSGFFISEDHATKIDEACNRFPRQEAPGRRWVYHTSDTYLAGTAINRRLEAVAKPDADLYRNLIVDDLWRPLGLSPLTYSSRRTRGDIGQPFTGWGITLHRDDVAKIVQFIGADDGHLNGKEVLDRRLFDAIKARLPDDPGLQAETERIRYNNGFRTYDVTEELGCENPTWLTTMSGFGGINFALMPNDTAYYYFSDGNVHRYLRAVRESHRIRSMCQ